MVGLDAGGGKRRAAERGRAQAEADLEKAAQEAGDAGLPGLATALTGVAARARTTRIATSAAMGVVAGGVVAGPMGAVAGGLAAGGLESTRDPAPPDA